MQDLPPERLHLPFSAGAFRMAMALVACPPDELVEIDSHYPAEMAERRTLLERRHHDVFAAEPGSEPARAETLSMLAELLPRKHPAWFTRAGGYLQNHLTGEDWSLSDTQTDPLEIAGRLVQEDLCLIDVSEPTPRLAAAILCAPSRWRLDDKIGRPLAAVHAPVPLYAERLSTPVDRFMNALRPGKLVERLNWSITDDPALFQQTGKHRTAVDPTITPANAAYRLFLRVERQTFARLSSSMTVLFAIHVHSYPLIRVLAVPGAAQDLAGAIRALPPSFAAYKSMPAFQDALLSMLDRHS